MIRHTITLESKEFGTLKGKTITVRVPENTEDCRTLTEAGDSDVLARFCESIVRAQNNYVRSKAAKILKDAKTPEEALAALQKAADEYKYSQRKEGSGLPRGPKTAKGRQQAVAASSGNRLFEKCAADEAFLARMVKQNVVDQAEYDAWLAARKEAQTPAPTPAK